jgi:hypothetical protein
MKVIDGEYFAPVSPEFTTDRVMVTPAVAEAWLETQKRNRVLNRNAVLSYRRDMLDGRWSFTADPIRFDVNGHLIDGQHRLTALALLDENFHGIDFLVVRGLEPETQMAMDQGRRRSSGQQLQLTGIKNSTSISAGVRLLMLWNTDRLFTRRWDDGVNISTASILSYTQANPELVDLANKLIYMIKDIGFRPAVGIAFVLRLGTQYEEEAEKFFSDMLTLVNQPEGSPLLAMSRRLQRSRIEGLKLPDVDQLAFLIRTWNNWVNGASATKLQRPPRGEWTDANFPKVEGL